VVANKLWVHGKLCYEMNDVLWLSSTYSLGSHADKARTHARSHEPSAILHTQKRRIYLSCPQAPRLAQLPVLEPLLVWAAVLRLFFTLLIQQACRGGALCAAYEPQGPKLQLRNATDQHHFILIHLSRSPLTTVTGQTTGGDAAS
jgi:hypothetical protein